MEGRVTSNRLPILIYHSVAERAAPGIRRLSVRPADLAAQLAFLRGEGIRTLSFTDVAEAVRDDRPLPPRAVALTFDDGYADFYETALPLLQRYGCTATIFVTTGWLDDADEHQAGRPLDRMLSWRQLGEISSAGIEIGAHSHSHAQLDQLSPRSLDWELRTSKTLLECRLGRPVTTLAYPFGYWSTRVREAVRDAGYQHAAAVANTTAQLRQDSLALPRLTVRRSTTLDVFEQIVQSRRIARTFVVARTLTAGWAVVRRSRAAMRSTA
jgi:peptidoglycan/xylan/chitin deacetylase (PgdA/CDA1 family)